MPAPKAQTHGEALMAGDVSCRKQHAGLQASQAKQISRLQHCILREIEVTTKGRANSCPQILYRRARVDGPAPNEWDSRLSPRPSGEVTFPCVVKQAGIERGRSYLVVFVLMAVTLGESLGATALVRGYEYRLWLEDLKSVEVQD